MEALQPAWHAPISPLQRPVVDAATEGLKAHPGAATVLLLLAPLLGAASVGRRRLRSRKPDQSATRVRVRADGRCLVRAVAAQVDDEALPSEVQSIANDDSHAARAYCQDVRRRAARRVREACEADEALSAVVSATFPDEKFDSFEDWLTAMETHDDTADAVSTLWQGGGSWLVYGLGLLYSATVSVTPLFPLPGGGFSHGTTSEVVDGGSKRVGLAMLMNDDGEPDHFDCLQMTEDTPATLDVFYEDAQSSR